MARIVEHVAIERFDLQSTVYNVQSYFNTTLTSSMGMVGFLCDELTGKSYSSVSFQSDSLSLTNGYVTYTSHGTSAGVYCWYITSNANAVDRVYWTSSGTSGMGGCFILYVIEGHNTSSFINVSAIASNGADSYLHTNPSITTTSDNCLFIQATAIGYPASNVQYALPSKTSWTADGFSVVSRISNIGVFSGYGFQSTAGTIQKSLYTYQGDSSTTGIIAINDATPSTPTIGILPVQKASKLIGFNRLGYATPATGVSTFNLVEPLNRDSQFTVEFDASTVGTSVASGALNGWSDGTLVQYDANGNTPISPLTDGTIYRLYQCTSSTFRISNFSSSTVSGITLTPGTGTHKIKHIGVASVNSATNWRVGGTDHEGNAFSISTQDLSEKGFYIDMYLGGLYSFNDIKNDGLIVTLHSANGWRSYNVGGIDSIPLASDGYIGIRYFIYPNGASYLKEYGTFDIENVNGFGYFFQTGYQVTRPAVYFRSVGTYTKYIVAGNDNGGSFRVQNLALYDNDIQYLGSGYGIIGYPIQIGDGVHQTKFTCPILGGEVAQSSDHIMTGQFNVNNSFYGVEFYGTDSCEFVWNKSYTGGYFVVNDSSSSSASYNFNNMIARVSYEIKFQSFNSIDSGQFISSCRITDNGATFTNCVFKSCLNANGYFLWTTDTDVTDSTFSDNGVAIEIDTAGDYTLDGIIFSGNTTDIKVTATTGTVNISIAGGGTAMPSYTTDGATVNIISGASLTFTGLKANSEVRVYLGTDPATATEIGGVENSGTSFTMSHSVGGSDGYIQIHHVDYESITLPIEYSSADQTIPIQQRVDRQYDNPA